MKTRIAIGVIAACALTVGVAKAECWKCDYNPVFGGYDCMPAIEGSGWHICFIQGSNCVLQQQCTPNEIESNPGTTGPGDVRKPSVRLTTSSRSNVVVIPSSSSQVEMAHAIIQSIFASTVRLIYYR
jgi:hypothetical protein